MEVMMKRKKAASRIGCVLMAACLSVGGFGGIHTVLAEEEESDFVPVTQAGRYEADESMILPGFTYQLASSRAVDGRQGIACSQDAYFVSGNDGLIRYDKSWEPVSEAEEPFSGFEDEVNHFGDIDFYNGEIYAGVENFMDGVADHMQIAVYDAETLKLARTYPVDAESGQTEVSGVAVDPDNKCIWLCSWADGESGRYLYRYDLETGEYLGKNHLQTAPQWIQGVSYFDGWLYLTANDGTADLGEPDHVYRCQADPSKSFLSVSLERSFDDVTLQGEIDGISFDQAGRQMLISYNRGARIVQDVPESFYGGYKEEVHEVFSYSMERNDRPVNYAVSKSWVSRPETPEHDADVFFILPTVNMRSSLPDNEDINNMKSALRFVKTFNMEKGIFSGSADIYAPYYRQATIASYMGEDGMLSDEMPEILNETVYDQRAYEDVKNAWDYYWSNLNRGKPVVLFGYSQGAHILLRLLSELGTNEAFSEQLVAAYAIGAPIGEDYITDHPYLKMAEGETDTGVIISYNAFDERAEKPAERNLAINPLNWKTDDTPAGKEENLGFVTVDTYGEITDEVAEYCGAYLDSESGVLVITDAENLDDLYNADNGAFPQGNYHMYDLNFFYRNLEENVAARIEAFLQ